MKRMSQRAFELCKGLHTSRWHCIEIIKALYRVGRPLEGPWIYNLAQYITEQLIEIYYIQF